MIVTSQSTKPIISHIPKQIEVSQPSIMGGVTNLCPQQTTQSILYIKTYGYLKCKLILYTFLNTFAEA